MSWHVLGRAIAIVGVRSPGKAAIVARAIQLGWEFSLYSKYRNARGFLIKALAALQNREIHDSEGVKVLLTGEKDKKCAIIALEYYDKERREIGWVYEHPTEGFYHRSGENSKWAWEDALNAFRERKIKRISEEKRSEILADNNVCHLIYLDDSLNAGNCKVGTENWMRQHGLSGKVASLKKVANLAKGNKLAENAVNAAISSIVDRAVA